MVNGTLNAEEYVKMLVSHFLPFCDEYYRDGFIVQQYNAPANKAKYTKYFFIEEEITDVYWPPHSTDMNIIKTRRGNYRVVSIGIAVRFTCE